MTEDRPKMEKETISNKKNHYKIDRKRQRGSGWIQIQLRKNHGSI